MNMSSKSNLATWKEAGVIGRVINTFLHLCSAKKTPPLKRFSSEDLYDRLGRSCSEYELKGDAFQSRDVSSSKSGDEEMPSEERVVADEQAETSERAHIFSLASFTTHGSESVHSSPSSSSQSTLMGPLTSSDGEPESSVQEPLTLPFGDTSTGIASNGIQPACREACDQGSDQQRPVAASHDAGAPMYQPVDRIQFSMVPSCVIMMPVMPCVTIMPTLTGRCGPIPAFEKPNSQQGEHLTCTMPHAQPSGVSQRGVQSLTEQTQIRECIDDASQASSGVANTSNTNVMVKNVPSNLKRHEVLNLIFLFDIDIRHVDFLYLPYDFRRRRGLGYFFLNFITHDLALDAQRKLEAFNSWSRVDPRFKCTKPIEVGWGTRDKQGGQEQLVKRFRNNHVFHPDVPEEWKPMLLVDGKTVPFPKPTKILKKPEGL